MSENSEQGGGGKNLQHSRRFSIGECVSLRMRRREGNRLWKYVRLRQTEEEMSFSIQRSSDSLKYIIKSGVARTEGKKGNGFNTHKLL